MLPELLIHSLRVRLEGAGITLRSLVSDANDQQAASDPGLIAVENGRDRVSDSPAVLGFVGSASLGETLCLTSIVRRCVEAGWPRPFIPRHRCTYAVFCGNPFVAGFRNEVTIRFRNSYSGVRYLSDGLAAEVGIAPAARAARCEVFLSDDEIKWAYATRALLPRGKPMAVVARRPIGGVNDDKEVADRIDRVLRLVSADVTICQIAWTAKGAASGMMRHAESEIARWEPEQLFSDVCVVENPSARQALALALVADVFCGPRDGWSDVMSCFEVPSMIVDLSSDTTMASDVVTCKTPRFYAAQYAVEMP